MKQVLTPLTIVVQTSKPVDSTPIKLIVGLGNPGENYAKTRHNAGFLFLAQIADQVKAKLKVDKHCFGNSAKVIINQFDVRLLAPTTFMNLSGRSVAAAMAYYKIELAEILIVHDELDLDAGIARLKLGGGHGGNNGLRDVIQQTGSKDFARLRIGIGHPGVGRDVANYVLKPPNRDDQEKIDTAIGKSLQVIDDIVVGDFPRAMNQLHSA
jgi:PTH1 family peptidyl-tRNA hydrolase